jgi:hypothetical protein
MSYWTFLSCWAMHCRGLDVEVAPAFGLLTFFGVAGALLAVNKLRRLLAAAAL